MWCDHGVWLSLCIGAIATPGVFGRLFNHIGAHGIEFDISVTGLYILLFPCQTGTEGLKRGTSPSDNSRHEVSLSDVPGLTIPLATEGLPSSQSAERWHQKLA